MTANLEMAVLAALVGEARQSVDSARLLLDETRVTARDFASDAHARAFALLEERIRQRRAMDTPAVMAHARHAEARLVLASALTAPDIGVTAERLTALREAATRRDALEALRAAASALKAGDSLAHVAELARAVPAVLDGVRGRVRETRGDTLRIFDAAAEAWTNGRRATLCTGWAELDAVWRLVPSLHVIGAQPGVGKSALAAGLVREWTRAQVKVGVVAWEDDALDMQRRILACDAGLSLAEVQGDFMPDDLRAASAEAAALARQALEPYLIVDDDTSGTLADAIASIREMHARRARVVILDNMTCVRLDRDGERHEELEHALIRIRDLAQKELRIPVIVVGHLKRGQSDGDELTKRPKLTDFAGAAAWERASRSALGLWWDAQTSDVCAVMLKQTNGVSGGVWTLDVRRSAATVVGASVRVEQQSTSSRYSR